MGQIIVTILVKLRHTALAEKTSIHPKNYASGESNSTRKRRTRLSASVEASLVKNDSVEMDTASREKHYLVDDAWKLVGYVLDLQNA